MNEFFVDLGMGPWKAVVTALVMPPVPFMVVAIWAGLLLWARRGAGWFLMALSFVGFWLMACSGFGQALATVLLHPPPALARTQIEALRQEALSHRSIAIVVLGGGREVFAPEYGVSSLRAGSLERLRYGLWLGRETGLPVAFSGGLGWGQTEGLSEAQIAARIATSDFGRNLRWIEEHSRDTRENAARSVAMLAPAGISEIVLVTHAWHMPRALRAFQEAGAGRFKLIAAPASLAAPIDRPALMWVPTPEGFTLVRDVLREWLGLLAGA